MWSAGQIPITFVCEEAHRYVPIDKTLGFEPTKRAISRIAKEGRKYGVSLCIVTQRPAELDPTILSQCNTIFSMRLTNERDQQILRAGISDAAASLLEFMPTMGTGEAITFGEGVALPTRIKFDMLPADCWPKSNTASFTKNWAKDLPDDGFLNDIVVRWRAQSHNPEALAMKCRRPWPWPSRSCRTSRRPLRRPLPPPPCRSSPRSAVRFRTARPSKAVSDRASRCGPRPQPSRPRRPSSPRPASSRASPASSASSAGKGQAPAQAPCTWGSWRLSTAHLAAVGGSSNGRTADSDSASLGSNPSPPAIHS